MGIKQSVYEKPGSMNYYKFDAKEYAMIKKLWMNIEIQPEFHGNACFRSFCEKYPQYVKYFTLEPSLPVNFDAVTTAKFSTIMEAMGFLLLDFRNKPKQLDRFTGYLAMLHKDMRLELEDMSNLINWLIQYLEMMYPRQMTKECKEVLFKYMNSILTEMLIKIKMFRIYDVSDVRTEVKPWRRCPILIEPSIFGKSKEYWDNRKKAWETRLGEWETLFALEVAEKEAELKKDEEEEEEEEEEEDEEENEEDIIRKLHRKATQMYQRISDMPPPKLILPNAIEPNESFLSHMQRHLLKKREEHEMDHLRHSHTVPPLQSKQARERHRERRVKMGPENNLIRRNNPPIRKRLRNTFSGNNPEKDKEETSEQSNLTVKSLKNARERHRVRFSLEKK